MKKKSLLFTAVATLGLTAATMAQNVPNYVPTNGLVGWWPFNGNANDESGHGNNGTINGATPTNDRFGNANQAYSFDGVNDRIEMSAQNFSVLSFTVSAWVNRSTFNGYGNIIGKSNWNDAQSESFGLAINETLIAASIKGQSCIPGQNWNTMTQVKGIDFDNEWQHVALTYDGNTIKIFLNTNLINESIISNGSFNCSGGQIKVGAWWQNMPQWFNGKIDDIGIWNRALDSTEISNLYNGNICYQDITVTDTLIINANLTGFNPVTYENTIKIWPNPTNDHITIDYGNYATLSGYQLKITNSVGQQMFQTNITQQSSYVDLGTWTGNGLYFVHIIDPQGNTIDIRKIVLQ
jgi:hypothetical protein